MQIALEHHQQVGKSVDSIGVVVGSVLLVVLEVGYPEGLDDPLHYLRLARQSELLQHEPHGLIEGKPCKVHLSDVVLPYLSREFVDVAYQLPDVRQVEVLQVLVQENSYPLGVPRKES